MDDLVAFVRARLDEDAAAADAAAQSGNQLAEPGGHDPRWQQNPGHNGGEIRDMCSPRGCIVVFDEGAPGREQAAHIARHDPARALREVEAKRRLVKEISSRSTPDVAEIYLAALAAVWSDHPDYRPEWKP